MFTGIVEETGTIKSIRGAGGSSQWVVGANKVLEGLNLGDSISINGVCLTVIAFSAATFTADLMPETIRRSTFRDLKPGDRVNLERALRLSDRLGGHLVSGHIDGAGKIEKRWDEDNAIWFLISAESPVLHYIVEKGSVAIDGISLTVAGADDRSFRVSVIPHTAKITTLSDRKTGDRVNIECDLVAKYIEKFVRDNRTGEGISREYLEKFGF